MQRLLMSWRIILVTMGLVFSGADARSLPGPQTDVVTQVFKTEAPVLENQSAFPADAGSIAARIQSEPSRVSGSRSPERGRPKLFLLHGALLI